MLQFKYQQINCEIIFCKKILFFQSKKQFVAVTNGVCDTIYSEVLLFLQGS